MCHSNVSASVAIVMYQQCCHSNVSARGSVQCPGEVSVAIVLYQLGTLYSALVRLGVLLPRDVGKMKSSWWIAIPAVSPFIKSLIKGRSSIRQMVKRSKFSELLWSELECRKVGVSKLPVEYHIHDLVGQDQLERYATRLFTSVV